MYDQGYYGGLIGSRIRTFDWYQNQRPWMTLNGVSRDSAKFLSILRIISRMGKATDQVFVLCTTVLATLQAMLLLYADTGLAVPEFRAAVFVFLLSSDMPSALHFICLTANPVSSADHTNLVLICLSHFASVVSNKPR